MPKKLEPPPPQDPLQTDQRDPANARYLVPLDDPEQEVQARSMADTIYGSAADEALIDGGGHITVAQGVEIYNQALVDARRMILDPEYARLFTG